MEEKWLKMPKFDILWAKIAWWYRYQKLVSVPMMQWASGTGTHWQCGTGTAGTSQSGTGTTASRTLIWHIFASLSPVFVHDCLGTLRND